jgi:hypothetical protein
LSLGAAGTQVGSYAVDFDFDGDVDFEIPVRSIDDTTAYADRQPDGVFDAVDSSLEYSEDADGRHVFTITLPHGGDGNPGNIVGPFTERLIVTLNEGLFNNPQIPGTYVVRGEFTSVDPDTDNADDGAGEAPLEIGFALEVGITDLDNDPPDAPALVFPADAASDVPTDVTLRWDAAADPERPRRRSPGWSRPARGARGGRCSRRRWCAAPVRWRSRRAAAVMTITTTPVPAGTPRSNTPSRASTRTRPTSGR